MDGEAVVSRAATLPAKPTAQMVADHCVSHLPFRNWCEHCARGRGRMHKHALLEKEHAQDNAAVVSMDYMFMGQDDDMFHAHSCPVLVVHDRLTKCVFAHVVEHKGLEDPYGYKAVLKDLALLGYRRLALKCDREHAILAVAQRVCEEYRGDISLEHPPFGEAKGKSNGAVEMANQRIQGLA
eukprot:573338-Amphidinium_carterae.1